MKLPRPSRDFLPKDHYINVREYPSLGFGIRLATFMQFCTPGFSSPVIFNRNKWQVQALYCIFSSSGMSSITIVCYAILMF